MTSWVEASGKTLEEAKEAAANELGVPVEQIEVEVLEEAPKGLFGLGQAKVRIRAGVPEVEAGVLPEEAESLEAEPEEQPEAEAEVAEEPALSKADRAIAMLKSVFEAMRFIAEPVLVSETDEEVQIDIVGASEDLGRLIGRHGQTLDALQYLLAISVNRGDPDKVRILLDAEGYRERHKQMLEARAREYAAKVKETGDEAVLEPQSARDRRIIHMALADEPDIYTYSEGEGDDRHVVISPKK
jgi:spoIIIJ-associated protein